MPADGEEDELVRVVALQNAQSILAARQRAERELSEERERLRITLASIGDAVITTDRDGKVTFLNGVAEFLTGWTCSEAAAQPLSHVFQIVNEYTREPVESPALRALRLGTVVGLSNHTILIARDGAERPIDDSAAPIRGESGVAIGAVLVFRDVTERKRAYDTQARLAAIIQSSDDAIISKDLNGIILSWNAGAERLFGYAHAEAVGQPIAMLIPPDRRDEERLILERLRNGQRVEPFETIRVAKYGRAIDISVSISPVYDPSGRVIAASKVARDISEKKRAERSLQQSEARLANLLEKEREQARMLRLVADAALTIQSCGSLDSVLQALTDESRRILSAEWVVSSLTAGDGHPQEASIGHARIDHVSGNHRDAPLADDLALTVCRTNQPMRLSRIGLESHFSASVASDAAAQTASLHSWLAVPLISGGGKNLGLIQLANKAAGDFSDDDESVLIQLARIGSIAVENAWLNSELRDRDRRKDEFLALLAHELRNPLAPISNGLDMMRMAPADPAIISHARGIIERQLGHMVRLVDDLLDASRINQHKMTLRRQCVRLDEILCSAVETARPLIDAAQHELSISLPPEPVLLDADLTRVAQVFSNLLTNSAKYTEPGGRIWLTAERRMGTVTVSVRDTGIGIPADALPRIFDMFSQVNNGLEHGTGGLGIGLALVKRLTEMHGGTVEASSMGLGHGSTFTVRLPLATLTELLPPQPQDELRNILFSKRVLVADDNRDAAVSMAKLLQILGSEVRTAHNGLEALEAAEVFRPQIIFMDVGMPKLDGFETTRRIRQRPWGKGIEIIALTGWGQEGDRARSAAAGCDRHLVKPVSFVDLKKILDEQTSPGSKE